MTRRRTKPGHDFNEKGDGSSWRGWAAPSDGEPVPMIWVFDERRREMRPPGGPIIDLSRRPVLLRILKALIRRRLAAPGAVVPAAELLAAGWPGELIRHDAAANRMKVALSTLRRLGLRALLVRDDGGYLLDPFATLVVENHLAAYAS